MLFLQVDSGKAQLGRRPDDIHREVAGLVPFRGVRPQAVEGETLRHLADHGLFFA